MKRESLRNLRKLLFLGLAGWLAVALAVPSSAPAPPPQRLKDIQLLATVTTSFDAFRANSQPLTMQFGGKISAGTTACLQNRVIQIFRISEGSVPDLLVTTTSTTGFAQGQFSTAGHPKVPGTYYAVAPEQEHPQSGDVCEAARSVTDVVT